MPFDIKRATNGPKHHFFGFHDLKITDASNKYILALEVEDISHPPLSGEKAKSGVVEVGGDGQFRASHETSAFNYPQGARQQWFGDTTLFTTNDRVGDTWGSRLSDATTCEVEDTFEFPIHSLCNDGRAFYINYARLYRNAVYGYIGILDKYEEDIPKQDGIWCANIKTKENKLLVSIDEVARCGEERAVWAGYPHYLTHLVLNPSQNRIAFLHRYRVKDGGEITRLMTIGTDGAGLRCLAKGFLSHFDWLDDDKLFMWGEHQPRICRMRESAFFSNKLVSFGVKQAKKIRQCIIRRKVNKAKEGEQQLQSKTFMVIDDTEPAKITKNGIGVLVSDGHPMTNPIYKCKIIVDNYPQADRCRTLMLYDYLQQTKIDIGKFRMIDDDVDEESFNSEASYYGVDERIKKVFPHEIFMHSRSGLHCDLHPRWSSDGKVAYFDSIHEGTRQIYSVDLSDCLL
ncbi:MAG: hypothetical protein J6Y82_11020 [Bacteroidales bacterium]|nr:hypothetical protein [Bacteroidales bacterium]